MSIPTSGRIFWPGTSGSIPPGWSEDSAFSDRFVQGSNSGYLAPVNSGSANHSHAASGHTHTGDSHVHTYSALTTAAGASVIDAATKPASATITTKGTHTHAVANSFSATIAYSGATVVVEQADGKPEYIKVVILQPDDGNQLVPNSGIVYTNELTALDGFSLADGNAGTTNIVDKFLLGADTGGDGGAIGGSGTHAHASSGHTHTIGDHSHYQKVSGPPEVQNDPGGFNVIDVMNPDHHLVGLDSKALTDLSSESGTINSASSDPAFVKLLGIQNTSGDEKLPSGTIIAFVGSFGGIPTDWVSVPETYDRQIKATASSGQVGDTSGSNTHTHTTAGHTHTHGSHNHTTTVLPNITGSLEPPGTGDVLRLADTHSHTWTIGTTVPTMQSSSSTMSSVDGRYKYRDVLFIKFEGSVEAISTISTSGDLFIQGIDSDNSSTDLFVKGSQLLSVSGNLFIQGTDSTQTSIDLFIEGIDSTDIAADLFVGGIDSDNNDSNLFIQGSESTSASGNLFIEGRDIAQASGDLFIGGIDSVNVSNDLFIGGIDSENSTIDLFIEGSQSISSSVDLFIAGVDSDNNNIDLFIEGSQSVSTSADLFIGGIDSSSDNNDLFIKGHEQTVSSGNLFIEGSQLITSSGDLFIGGTGVVDSISLSADLFTLGHQNINGSIDTYIGGHESSNANIDLFVDGHQTLNISKDLFIQGVDNTQASGNLFIDGNQLITSSGNLFIQGGSLINAISISGNLFIGGIETENESINLFINGLDVAQVSGDLFINGSQLHSASGNLFILGPQPPSNSFDLFISSSGVAEASGTINYFINGVEPRPVLLCPALDSTLGLQIADSLIDTYQSRLDALINQLGKNVLLEFDPIREPCPNCEFDIIRKRSTGVYKLGGPRPFMRGRKCPWCKGRGLLETAVNKCIQCLVEWSVEDNDEDFDISINDTPGVVRLKTFLSVTDDLIRARTIIVNYDIVSQIKMRARLIRGPFPAGLREDRYSISFWELI